MQHKHVIIIALYCDEYCFKGERKSLYSARTATEALVAQNSRVFKHHTAIEK